MRDWRFPNGQTEPFWVPLIGTATNAKGTSSDVDVLSIIGGVAAALAIAAAALATLRWLRSRWIRRTLRQALETLRDYDAILDGCVRSVEAALEAGVGWSGWAIFPEPLATQLDRLITVDDTLDELVAHLRAVDAHGSNERVREILEDLAANTATTTATPASVLTPRRVTASPSDWSSVSKSYTFPTVRDLQLITNGRESSVLLPEGAGRWRRILAEGRRRARVRR